MLVYLIIQNLRLDYIFDIRRNYGFNIKNIRKIYLLFGYQYVGIGNAKCLCWGSRQM